MKTEEYQRILSILGYSLGQCDGKHGAKTTTAVKNFQKKYGLKVDGVVGKNTIAKLKSVGEAYCKNFKKSEFTCKCGCKTNKQLLSSIMLAQKVRSHFGKASRINSGTRCTKHNKAVGGVANSRHLVGKAFDINVSHTPSTSVNAYAQSLIRSGIARYAYRINANAVHIDVL